MKKIIFFIIASFILSNSLFSQVKVNFSLTNWGFDTVNIWKFDLVATVQTGQVWRVGSCNIRIDFYTDPSGRLTVHPDNSTNGGVRSANSNLNNNSSYDWMTTTSINNGTAISLNIVWRPGTPTYHLNPGAYTIGRLRFNRIDTCCTYDTIRHSGAGVSVIFDSLTQLSNTQWSVTNPPPCVIVGIKEAGSNLPTVFKLYDNYPNPFNPVTTIKYDIPKATHVKLTIFDMLGREVKVLFDGQRSPGYYEIQWDATNFASGAYFYKLESEYFTDIKKMILIK
jgi:hypothetical protein